MPGSLVVCATPIGNLGDASPRLAEALGSADIVYAEDTRRARTLLDHLDVSTPLRSYFVGNEAARSDELAERLAAGERVALISDAGTPAIADPGVSAVRTARSVGADVTAIPGPSAVTTALAVSGLGGDRFTFEGFLPRKGGGRTERLDDLATRDHPTVFFTTGHRVDADLADIAAIDADRHVVVCRELTKLYEEVWSGRAGEAVEHWAEATKKGEFTVVVDAAAAPVAGSMDDALVAVRDLVASGERPTAAAKAVAKAHNVDRGDLYDRLVNSDTQD
jgi:16S rRNA (cytidine1402-2'-O)-methyltransferase